ncbi:alpha/beta fold hydrolase [Sandaracinobacteroides saxicola]|uniref:Alpha/beta fold hydrolase n=1 Tax=Sandaracinobacteroides saxicola TaxID=2759707 RepID=A0A7G5IL82_9SPHN|nr:alpha/beta hydrolase [Sandaracinobacteroides saxicola]QMW24124.1 alpha/beta fold hydrolase [Sandaracinobacteroides saxicola]
MRRHLLPTPHGHIHLRDWGEGGTPLMLLHWTPLSSRIYMQAAPYLARTRRLLAPDLLGYGQSDPRPADWSLEAWADSLLPLLDQFGIPQTDLLGGHLGASIATEFALRHPARVRRLILDGVPLLTPDLRAAFAALATTPRPGPDSATLAWDRTIGLLTEYIPGFTVTPATLDMVWATMRDYLATDFVTSGPLAARHDLGQRLPLLIHPILLLGAEQDSLAGTFAPAHALLPHAERHFFPGHHPLHMPDRAADYANIINSFLERP